MELSVFILEIIGTVAFAASGAKAAIDKKMDIFGVIILALTTAVGGGIIRDLLLGKLPPATFTDPVYAAVAAAVAVLLFIKKIRNFLIRNGKAADRFMLITDSIGLGVFTVVGVRAGLTLTEPINYFLSIFVGVVTGVGGGVMRDLFAGEKPGIFVKDFYATASLIGALVTAALWNLTGELWAMVIGGALIFILRLLASKYRWNLPRAD